ncbi:MAG TPA: hypothetical protein VKB18_04675 [Gemmatimonadota bacterium]|nr:hypothetical protein [Gemmatimonadota bacterium]
MTFRTHVPLSGLSPTDARRILASLEPLLAKLRERASSERPEEASVVDLPAPPAGRPREGGSGDAGAAGARVRAG